MRNWIIFFFLTFFFYTCFNLHCFHNGRIHLGDSSSDRMRSGCSPHAVLTAPQFWVRVHVCARSLQACVTLWTVAHQTPVRGILQARVLEWVAVPSFRGLPHPGLEPTARCASRIAPWGILTPSLQGRPFESACLYLTGERRRQTRAGTCSSLALQCMRRACFRNLELGG